MARECATCGNKHPYRFLVRIDSNGKREESCDRCGNLSPIVMPDAYLEGKGGIRSEEHLADKNGNPIPYGTKGEKAAIMKKLGVREAGDRVGGSRNEEYINRRKHYGFR